MYLEYPRELLSQHTRDDTALLFEGESWEEVRDVAERGLLTVKRWFDQCRLTVNIAKTKCMPISIRADGDPFVFKLRLHTCGGQDGCVLCECIDRSECLVSLYNRFDCRPTRTCGASKCAGA
ncbi:hypothetical protein J6590_058034 [Homalodisca vitripennis]|nr:hypothetical protein J6590_058034 [Homalodisca vitripennis]